MSTSSEATGIPRPIARRRGASAWGGVFMTLSRVILLAVLIVAGILVNQHFLNFHNVINMVRHASLLALISYGMTLALLTGGIELSVGSTVALSSCVAAPLLLQQRWVEGVAVALGVGAVVGAVNGGMIAYLRIPAFIATYAMMRVARGLALLWTGGKSQYDFATGFRKWEAAS